MTAVTPTDRPKSVRNRCVIEVLVAFLCCPLVFELPVGIGVFVIGLSQISFFFCFSEVVIFVVKTFSFKHPMVHLTHFGSIPQCNVMPKVLNE